MPAHTLPPRTLYALHIAIVSPCTHHFAAAIHQYSHTKTNIGSGDKRRSRVSVHFSLKICADFVLSDTVRILARRPMATQWRV